MEINKDGIKIIRKTKSNNTIKLNWWRSRFLIKSILVEKVKFWIYSKLKGGVVYITQGMTISDAFKKVRKGGYIIIMPGKSLNKMYGKQKKNT